MKTEHTPGPWVYGPEFSAVLTRDKQGTVAILLPLGHTRDDEEIDTELMDAHGRLMAAAPEMLEFIRKVLRWELVDCDTHEYVMDDDEVRVEAERLLLKIFPDYYQTRK